MNTINITKDISIEELVEKYPFSVEYMAKNGIRCIVCGEPIWGTLEEAALEKGFAMDVIEKFVSDLNDLAENFKEYNVKRVKPIDIGKMK